MTTPLYDMIDGSRAFAPVTWEDADVDANANTNLSHPQLPKAAN